MNKILTCAYSFKSAKILRDQLQNLLNTRILVTKRPFRIRRRDNCLVRYGNLNPVDGIDNLINPPDFIRLCSNKFLTSQELRAHDIYTPQFLNGRMPDDNEFPVIIRTTLMGAGGRGIITCKDRNEFNSNWRAGYYWTPFVKTEFELRVHVANGKIIKIFKKIPDHIEGDLPIRNLKRGYHFSLKDIETYPKVIELVKKLNEFITGKFYALDLGYDKEKKQYFVFEFNSAPGLNENSALAYAEEIRNLIGE